MQCEKQYQTLAERKNLITHKTTQQLKKWKAKIKFDLVPLMKHKTPMYCIYNTCVDVDVYVCMYVCVCVCEIKHIPFTSNVMIKANSREST